MVPSVGRLGAWAVRGGRGVSGGGSGEGRLSRRRLIGGEGDSRAGRTGVTEAERSMTGARSSVATVWGVR